MMTAAAAAAAICTTSEKADSDSIHYPHIYPPSLTDAHNQQHQHSVDDIHYSALSLATLAALHQDRLLASKNSSIADLRLKAKKHSEALLLDRASDKQMEPV